MSYHPKLGLLITSFGRGGPQTDSWVKIHPAGKLKSLSILTNQCWKYVLHTNTEAQIQFLWLIVCYVIYKCLRSTNIYVLISRLLNLFQS